MRINVEKVCKNEGLSSDYSFSLDLSEVDYWGERPFKTPINVEATVRNRAGMIILTTHAEVRFETGCARCTKDVVQYLPVDTENYVVINKDDNDDDTVVYAENYWIDLDEVVTTAVVLSMPMRALCKEDCQGLCPRCGKDLNDGPCGCTEG